MKLHLYSMAKAALKVGILCLLKTHVVADCGDGNDAMKKVNDALAAQGVNYRLDSMDLYTSGEHAEMGRTVYYCDRGNKQLPYHFVPNDPRRYWSTSDSSITILADSQGATSSGLSFDDTAAAFERAHQTWQDVECSNIPLEDYGAVNFLDFGIVQSALGFGGIPVPIVDILHGGFQPGAFFDALAPGGSNFILGVAFTFVFGELGIQTGEPTDIDNNGKLDKAFTEIYFNDNIPWNIGDDYDVETLALHEVGHGLSQAHFGEVFRTKNGKLHFAPRAVMNAVYSGVQLELTGTDIGGHCSIWGSWPGKPNKRLLRG